MGTAAGGNRDGDENGQSCWWVDMVGKKIIYDSNSM
jgi:hypothetical protein